MNLNPALKPVSLFMAVLLAASCVIALYGQTATQTATPVNIVIAYAVTPISATAAVNAQTTLTIPAPASGLYNYVCTLHYNASQNGTSTANTNQVTTSTNFNSYAIKYSLGATANASYDWIENWSTTVNGCAKSTSPATATTFVSPAALLNTAFTWTATYYQAP